ncbi:major tail protein [Clostridium saccharoperbutylacetonicum]|uniref:major tail protein n=1 Tax=Clostridium saccharoperbutylacetonicum TaxID=36745 RepID=UPI0039E753B7
MADIVKEFKQVEGCRNIHVAKRKIDGTYEVPIGVRGLAEIKTTDTFMEGTSIGDMRKMISKKKKSGIDIAITANELPAEVESLLMGKKYVNGELVSNVDDNQSEVALLWEEVWSDGSSTYNIIYRTKLARESREGKGNSDKLDFQTISINGSALALPNGDFDMNLDPSATGVDANKVTNFFAAVQMPGVVVTP